MLKYFLCYEYNLFSKNIYEKTDKIEVNAQVNFNLKFHTGYNRPSRLLSFIIWKNSLQCVMSIPTQSKIIVLIPRGRQVSTCAPRSTT
jgi:hypothetical protein